MERPDFILIGAAKTGTTALYWYLNEHPEVHMSPLKETNFFAYGVDEDGRLLYGDPELHRFPIKTPEEYAELFKGAGRSKVVGEASPIYLECPQAATRIKSMLPNARIICGLRHPVDRAYSDYLMYLRNRGRRFVPETELATTSRWAKPDSHWMRLGLYHDQLSRYFELFPRQNIHIYLFDDLKTSETAVLTGIYRFLGVDPTFSPDTATPHNVGGVPTSMTMERFLTSRSIRRMAEPFVPKRVADWVRRLRMLNMGDAPRLPEAMKAELTTYFRADLAKTAELIGRDLTAWM